MIKAFIYLSVCFFTITSFSFIPPKNLKGTWIYAGGVYNGKAEGATNGYTLKRIYTEHDFIAYAYEKGYKTQKYEAGDYKIKGDTCFETTTFSSQPSQLVGKKVAYLYTLKNNELMFSATLPSGMVVEEHWRKP